MDGEDRRLISEILVALRRTFEMASVTQEMGFRMHKTVSKLDPRFREVYSDDSDPSYAQMVADRERLLVRLDVLISKFQ
jgi:hypothetical protein